MKGLLKIERKIYVKKKAMYSGLAVTTALAVAMTPVAAEAKYDAAIQYVKDEGIAQGLQDGSFGEQLNIKRGDAAVMVAKAARISTEDEVSKAPFTDLVGRSTAAVTALAAKGIVQGKTKTTFAPNEQLKRSEFAMMLVKAYDLPLEEGHTAFTDVSPRLAPYVNALVKAGIASGKTATQFAPDAAITRGELALFLHRAAKHRPEGGQVGGEPTFDLTIMHFNDTHAHLDNAAKRVTAVNEIRSTRDNTLLLDAGDVFSGSLYFNEFKGQADLQFMNMMKVDAMTFGNHEFDLGSTPEGHKALADFVKAAQFPIVSSNVDVSKDPLFEGLFSTKIATDDIQDGHIYKGIVKEIDGEKVGIFGLTTEETADISSPKQIEFSNYIQEAKVMVKEFEKMGIDKVIAVTHIGFDDNPAIDNDQELAKAVPQIDVIVGGHSHTKLDEPVKIGNTLIVQAFQYGENLGVLDVSFDDQGVVTKYKGELIKVADRAEDPEAAKVLAQYSSKIEELKTTPIGAEALEDLTNPRTSDDPNDSVRRNETALGNIITDGMLTKARTLDRNGEETIMALQNGGGIRTSIPKGQITIGQVISVLPFTNTLATMHLTGAELKAAFEHSLKEYPQESGGFLHISGGKVQFDSSKPVGQRIISVEYYDKDNNLQPIEDSKTYKLATNAFTAKGGDGYDMFKKAYEEGRVTDLGLSDWENFAEQLKSLKQVNNEREGRIVDIKK